MDIEQFYDADERRRESSEVELGTEWRDAGGVRYELNWIEDTGELYVMMEPPPPEWEGPFGDLHVNVRDSAPVTGMAVFVVGHITTRDELEHVLDGWQAAMSTPGAVEWLAKRLISEGVADQAWASGLS